MRCATNYTKLNQRRLLAHISCVSYHAKATRKKGESVSLLRIRRTEGKNATDLSINLAANFMNCVHDFLPASDMLRTPDSGCILPLSSSRRLSRKFSDCWKAYPCLVMRIPSVTISPAPPRIRWT
jgi:hypothetical protein